MMDRAFGFGQHTETMFGPMILSPPAPMTDDP
jgi:hypothetical protein